MRKNYNMRIMWKCLEQAEGLCAGAAARLRRRRERLAAKAGFGPASGAAGRTQDASSPAGSKPGSTGECQGFEPGLDDPGVLLNALLDNSPDKIYFKDSQSRFTRYSRSFAQQFGLGDPALIRGRSDFDYFSEEHARSAFQDEQEIMRSGKPLIGKMEKETYGDGRVTWALTTKMPLRGKGGEIMGTFGVSKDVTVLKEVEEKLAHEQELLRTLLENVPDCIYFKDSRSRFVMVSRSKAVKSLQRSPKLKALWAREGGGAGRSEAELLVGLTDFDVFAEEHARPAFEDEQRIMSTSEPIIDKLEKQTHPDGSVTWALSTKMPWRDRNGKLVGTFGISRDITALKQTEAELEAAHKRLVESSRLAGMAEVASDVLHNVGNTLNSINVSCSLAIDRVKQSNLANLAKIPELLRQRAGRLDEFLTSDPQGKHIPEYLLTLTRTFDEQKTFLLEELGQLRRHVEHVNQIVAMQQSYAKVAGLEEQIEVNQLVEDALQINAAALERHEVCIRRELEPTPPILVDKHKVLQILVNLIRNAKYALSDAARSDKVLTVRVTRNGSEQLKIQVIDNGVGIPAENLTRIFAHGFTTRRDGHGFGLHSGALAARELGGALSAQSDGPGQGAIFTLTLPLKTSSK
jgi:PAS domain S-box-containing protein